MELHHQADRYDAAYTYYKHGPLARISLGDQHIQGIDYAYTLQGWLKSINGDAADSLADMGRDGRTAYGITPKDVFATSIDYFNGDYTPIGQVPLTTLPVTPKNLYNGNIARQTTDVTPFGALTTAYTYDQLNRIRQARYGKRNPDNTLSFNNWYASSYRYDQDGNLRALTRRDSAGTLMDNFSYYYPNSTHNNRLGDVLDSASFNVAGIEDIKHHIPSTPGLVRFQYDEDGHVLKDMTSGTDSVQWNIYGKATDIENRANRSKLHFVYDGAGQRVSKNQTITSDSGHVLLNTYYVRDASGNILAEYKSRQDYRRENGRIISWTGDVVRGSTDPLMRSIHDLGLDMNIAFKGSLTEAGGGMSIAYTPGHYLSANAPLLQQVLSNNTDELLAGLCTYGATTQRYPLGDATMLSLGAGNEEQLLVLGQALFQDTDAGLRRHALTQLGASLPDLYQDMMFDLGMDSVNGPSDSTLIAEHMLEISENDPTYLLDKLQEYYTNGVANPGMVNPVHRWVQVTTADPLYYNGLFQDAGLTTLLADNLVGYGYAAASAAAGANSTLVEDEGFFGFVNTLANGMDLVLGEVSPEDLEQIVYDEDPLRYMKSVEQYAGASALDEALHAMGETLDIGALYDHIKSLPQAPRSLPYGEEPRMTNMLPVLKRRQVDLTGHHLYGSSRLGISGYWPGQYGRIWDYDLAMVDTSRLGGNRPWYSGAYNDVIAAGKTTPYGYGLQSMALGQHVLGQKQYELSNHLGNVQATVSDARYVQSTGGGLRFKNSIVAAYDYYPFGMLMPGRFVSDTAQRSAVITQSVLTPRVVSTPVALGSGVAGPHSYLSWLIVGGGALTVSGQGGDLHFMGAVTPQVPLMVEVQLGYTIGYTTVFVSEYINGSWQVQQSGYANYGRTVSVPLTPTTNQVRITVSTGMMYANSVTLFTIGSISLQQTSLVPQLMATSIYNTDRDRYSFGFNGQMKDNEVAGIGNHNTALFWEYDTRLGRRWNLDPKPHVGISNYSVFGSNPIYNVDPNGDYFTEAQGSNGLKKLEMVKAKANNNIEKYKKELVHDQFSYLDCCKLGM